MADDKGLRERAALAALTGLLANPQTDLMGRKPVLARDCAEPTAPPAIVRAGEPFDAAEVVDKALALADALVARLKEGK